MGLKLPPGGYARMLGRKTKYVVHIEKFIGEGEFEWSASFGPKLSDDAWHPSGDCVPSLHELYMKATGQMKTRSHGVALRKSFAVGHFWHAYLQELTVRSGMCDAEAIERRGTSVWAHEGETPKPYHWAIGSGDVAPCELPGHGAYLIDYKTMKGVDFRVHGLPKWCAEKYEAQVNIYMSLFELEKALIVCIEKDGPHELKEVEFHLNQPLVDAIFTKWHLASECIAAGVEPPEDLDVELPFNGPVSIA